MKYINNKTIARTLIAGAILAKSVMPSYAGIFGDMWESVKAHPWRWAAGTAATIIGINYYNDLQKKNPYEDKDGDGMIDSLERQYFGNLDQNPNDDYDKDGYTNLEELSKGSDPTNKDSIPYDDDDSHTFSVKSSIKSCNASKASLNTQKATNLETSVNPEGFNFAIAKNVSKNGTFFIHGRAGRNYNVSFMYNHRFK